MTDASAATAPAKLVLPDRESEDGDLTVRPQMFMPTQRLVLVIGHGDEETGTSDAVALDRGDVERLREALTAWLGDGGALNIGPAR